MEKPCIPAPRGIRADPSNGIADENAFVPSNGICRLVVVTVQGPGRMERRRVILTRAFLP